MQRAKKFIDQEMYEGLVGPLNHLLAQHDKDVRMLKEQKGISEDWDRLGERLELAMSRYAGSLDELDADGLQRLMRLLNIRLTREPDGVVVTGILDPTLFTTEQTLECPSNWFYTVVLKPNPSKWPVIKLRAGRRKRPSS